MFCVKCQRDLILCSCPDLAQRLEALAKHPVIGLAARQNQDAIKALEKEKS